MRFADVTGTTNPNVCSVFEISFKQICKLGALE